MPILGIIASRDGGTPTAPTIGTATATGPTTATVAYTASTYTGKGTATYVATSSPGGLTGTGSSPITVSGLTSGTAYTFTVKATSTTGETATSAASNSITPTNPSLGAWSSSTQYPLTTITLGIGNGNGSVIYVGGGLVNGSDVVSNGYTWVSGWTSLSLPSERYQMATQRLTTSGSSNALMMLAGYGANFASSNLATIFSGSSFSAGTVYPISGSGIGFASLNGSGNVRASGSSLTGYYQTSFGGSWTTTGVNQPVPAGRAITMVDNNFGGEGYLFTDNVDLLTYKCTSTTSAWTAMTSLPWSSSNSANPAVAATVISNTVMLFKSQADALNPYTFNGTTYTSQTAISGSLSVNYNTIGAIGNVLHNIRIAPNSNASANYHLVSTFA